MPIGREFFALWYKAVCYLSVRDTLPFFRPMERIRIVGNGNIVLDIVEYDENGMLTRCEHLWLDTLAEVRTIEKTQNKQLEIWN